MRTEPTAEQVLPLPELLDEHREHEYVEVVLGNIDDDIAVKYVPQDLQAEENEPFAKMICELLAHGNRLSPSTARMRKVQSGLPVDAFAAADSERFEKRQHCAAVPDRNYSACAGSVAKTRVRSTLIIRVDTRGRMLDLVDANRVIASFPITPGSKACRKG